MNSKKLTKNLKHSLRVLAERALKAKLNHEFHTWYNQQPGSVKRGFLSGHIEVVPAHLQSTALPLMPRK